MNSDNQQMAGVPISTRVARLFFEDHKNTAEIATIIGWNEAAIDRLVSKILDGAYCLRAQARFEASSYLIGDRIRLNSDALVLWRKHIGRQGIVTGYARNYRDCLMVRWDGRTTSCAFAASNLELVERHSLTASEQSDNAKRGYDLAIQTLREPIAAKIELFSVSRATKNPHHIGYWWRLRMGWRSVKDNHGPFVSAAAALADAEQALGTREPMAAAQKPE